MNTTRVKIRNKFISISTSISSFLIPIFQYVPCTGVWFGIMSVPLLSYLAFFFQNPGILYYDIRFLVKSHGFIILLLGLGIFIYSLIIQLSHRNQLIRTGPYRYIRHPQYLAFIIMTFGMTIIVFQTSPIINFDLFDLNTYTFILYLWIGEVLAYIILGKIEDIALKAKYGDQFLEYKNKVNFLFPTIKLKRIESKDGIKKQSTN